MPSRGLPPGHHPRNLLRGARSVVVMGIHLLDGAFELVPSREYSITYQVANLELDRSAFHVAKYLQGQGHRALQVPASPPYDLKRNRGDLSHRHAAQRAGIGVFGKNSLLLSPEFGPRIRLTSVVTDAALEPSVPLDVDLCGDCDICLHACPVDVFEGPGIVNKSVCDATTSASVSGCSSTAGSRCAACASASARSGCRVPSAGAGRSVGAIAPTNASASARFSMHDGRRSRGSTSVHGFSISSSSTWCCRAFPADRYSWSNF